MLGEIKSGIEVAGKVVDKGKGIFNYMRIPYQAGEDILTKVISENGKITENDIQAVAMQFMVKKFVKKIKNYDNIITKAEKQFDILLEQATEKISLHTPDEEWIEYFFDMSSRVSNETVQKVWARILLQEHVKNGGVKKVMINSLALLDAESAMAFKAICTLTYKLIIEDETRIIPLVLWEYNIDNLLDGYEEDPEPFERYKKICPSEKELDYLTEIGLVTTTNLTSSTYTIYFPEKSEVTFKCNKNSITIEGSYDEEQDIYQTEVSFVLFTQVGLALYEALGFTENKSLFPVLKRFVENQIPYNK